MVAAAGPSADAQGHAGRVALKGIGPIDVRRSSAAFEAVLAYLTADLTVRGNRQGESGFRATECDGAAILWLVWAERWW